MKTWKINSLQFGTFVAFIILSTLIGVGVNSITEIAKVDSYISVILGYFIGFIPMLIFIYLFSQNKSIDELINDTFGKIVGTIINIIILIPIIIIAACTMYSISNFIVSQFLSDTPIIYINLLLAIVLFYGSIKGIEVVSRVSLILFVITVMLFLFAIIGLIPQVQIDNYLPMLEHGFKNPFLASLIFVIQDIIPIFIVLAISKKNIVDKEKANKKIIFFYSIAVILSLSNIALTIGTLGTYLTELYQYPEYMVLKKISIFNFLDRIENFISIQWIFRNFIVISIVIYHIKNLFKKDNDSKLIPLIVLTIIIILDTYMFKNNTIFTEFALHKLPFINVLYFFMMVFIAISVFIKNKKDKIMKKD